MLFPLTSIRPTQFPEDLNISLSSDSYWRIFPSPQQVLSSDEVFFLASSYSCQAKLMTLETHHEDPLHESHIHLVIQVISKRCMSSGFVKVCL